ncbi:MAG: cadmium-translocating P-type ATPase [Xanthomonadales bacterium]|nr:cadmium-translocating P-type ATPase [Xanthomonadales bacterium]
MDERITAACFHCNEPIDARMRVVDAGHPDRAYCCQGCAAAARFIQSAGLADYYRLRSASAGPAIDTDFSLWDRAELLDAHSTPCPVGREITVLSDGMRCAACAWLIDRSLSREPSVDRVQANAVTGRIRIRWDPSVQPLSALLDRIARLGYPVSLAPDASLEQRRLRDRRMMMLRIGVAALGALQAMMFAEALYLDFDRAMPESTRDFFRWLTLLVSTPVVFFSGWPFIAGMLRELRARVLGMDTLIAGSILLAYAASLVETLRGGPHVWFDAAVMFVLFLLAARGLDQFARARANAQVDRLARATPQWARRVTEDGGTQSVPIAALSAGDVVEVAVGSCLPADGELLDDAELDESLLTGESRPQSRARGERVLAGSQCVASPIRVRVEQIGQRTWISSLVRAVEAAQADRPAAARHADRLASRFVTTLLIVAAATYLGWLATQPERTFEVFLAVLVISCPCALSLAVPTALVVTHGALARAGLLALRPDRMHELASLGHLVVDKTGTLSVGAPELVDTRTFADCTDAQARSAAAALEHAAGHPLARAFAAHARADVVATHVTVHPGAGVEGTIDGQSMRLGSAPFALGQVDDGALWLATGGRRIARFATADRLRADARSTVSSLRQVGVTCTLASGDAETPVGDAARAVGIDSWHARMTPQGKLDLLRSLRADAQVVGMLGDGINDAPVLAGADVSIAMASGNPVAHHAADFVLLHGRLGALPEGIALARRSERIIRQNLAWAAAYNFVALPFAVLGLVTPWAAALGMTASSLIVTLNALRIARGGKTQVNTASESHGVQPDLGQTA